MKLFIGLTVAMFLACVFGATIAAKVAGDAFGESKWEDLAIGGLGCACYAFCAAESLWVMRRAAMTDRDTPQIEEDSDLEGSDEPTEIDDSELE